MDDTFSLIPTEESDAPSGPDGTDSGLSVQPSQPQSAQQRTSSHGQT